MCHSATVRDEFASLSSYERPGPCNVGCQCAMGSIFASDVHAGTRNRLMEVVIFCGGKGTRLGEVTENKIPKPMAPVGDQPILWHIMRSYARAGYRDFVLTVGHLGMSIKEYFLNYHTRVADIALNTRDPSKLTLHHDILSDDWNVTIAETGEDTQTAGRLARVMKYITGDTFMLTYGDGVSDIDLTMLEAFHREHGKAITISGVIPPGRFGELVLHGDKVVEMSEKPTATDRYINGGFMVIERRFVERFIGTNADAMMLERGPMRDAAEAGEMMIYKHDGFWQCMDTYRDWALLNDLWRRGGAPWT